MKKKERKKNSHSYSRGTPVGMQFHGCTLQNQQTRSCLPTPLLLPPLYCLSALLSAFGPDASFSSSSSSSTSYSPPAFLCSFRHPFQRRSTWRRRRRRSKHLPRLSFVCLCTAVLALVFPKSDTDFTSHQDQDVCLLCVCVGRV